MEGGRGSHRKAGRLMYDGRATQAPVSQGPKRFGPGATQVRGGCRVVDLPSWPSWPAKRGSCLLGSASPVRRPCLFWNPLNGYIQNGSIQWLCARAAV